MSAAQAILQIHRQGHPSKTLQLDGELSVGRSAECGLQLEDQSVSRKHATLKLIPGGKLEVEARSEFSPIRINGSEVPRGVISQGDELQIGPFRIFVTEAGLAEKNKAPVHTNPVPLQETVLPVIPDPVDDLGNEIPSEEIRIEAQPPEPSVPSGQDFDSFSHDDSGSSEERDPFAAASDSGDASFELQEVQGAALESDAPESFDSDGKTRAISTQEVHATLSFLPGAANYTEFEFKKDEVSVGRGSSCDIVLNDKKASRKHMVIRRKGLSFLLVDLESANGTFVNGETVREIELTSGDIIQIGNVEFRFDAQNLSYENQESGFDAVEVVEEQALMSVDSSDESSLGGDVSAVTGTGLDSALGGLSGVSGVSEGNSIGTPSDGSLIGKFRALPKEKRLLYGVVGVLGIAALLFDEGDFSSVDPKEKAAQEEKAKKEAQKKAGAPSANLDVGRSFDQLTPDEQRFVMNQHQLALDHFRNKEYDKALFEVRRIFSLVQDYQEARAIERYALEGKEKLEALETERRRKEDEAKLKAEIEQLVSDAREAMVKKEFELAEERFGPIIALDPSNVYVENWKKEIEAWKEEQDRIRMEKRVDEELNQQARLALQEAVRIQKAGDYHQAILAFGKVGDFGGSDSRPGIQAKEGIEECKNSIAQLRDPVLKEAKSLEDSGDLASAYKLFDKSTQIDPGFPEGYAGMSRIRGALHDRAKVLYTEGVLAESYSDFDTAQKRFSEILTFVPKGDLYFGRAKRKLAPYRTITGASSREAEASSSDGTSEGFSPVPTEGGGGT